MSTQSPNSGSSPRRTPLYDRHVALGARVIDFGGWAMPVQYESILEEHKAVRTAVGLFDVSHMGEVEFVGPGALSAVEHLVTNDVRKLVDGQARYTVVCFEDGGIVDDCIVYREHAERFVIVVNAANIDKDVAWFRKHVEGKKDVVFRNLSDEIALIAVQGPLAVSLLQRLCPDTDLRQIKSFHFQKVVALDLPIWAARTGYTGEDGFELFVQADGAARLWDALLTVGRDLGVKPIGLGARDTLRLEACLSLYGNDIDATTHPFEANLGWVVKLDHDFIGRSALENIKTAGNTRKLAAFSMEGRGTARHGYTIYDAETGGSPIGTVTSGSLGPTVGKNIGLGYVPLALAEVGTRFFVDCRGKRIAAVVVKPPFYRRPAI
ncbi:MAG TPA: glycine cleavage system aminomethyltransferase GcvT [Pseudomonadota bacterium]|nr:glycine cleavage system aminomethyltransferase GcvT [Pseudomonadota bacterium]